MMKYVLVLVEDNNYTIGINHYDTETEAIERQSELLKVGVKLEVMTFGEAVGVA